MMRYSADLLPFMRPWIILFAWIAAARFSTAQEIAPTLLRDDFRIMRKALEDAHGGIYRYTSKPEMNRTFDRAYRRIDRPMTDLEFWRLIAPVVARVKCGHTFLRFPKALQAQFDSTIPVFPLEVRVFGGRAYVYQDYFKPGSALEGSELLSINGVPTGKLLKQLETIFTGDGNTHVKAWRIGHLGGFNAPLHGLGLKAPFRVAYRTKDGKRHSAGFSGMTLAEQSKAWDVRNPKPEQTNADLKFLDDGSIAVLTIRHWYQYADPERKVTFLDFLKNSFAQIRTNQSRNLIIDVRDNDGGLDAPGKQLFAFLWDRPFYYDEKLVINALRFDFYKYDPDAVPIRPDIVEQQPDGRFHLVKHPNVGLQQPAEPHFAGKVFVLMNGGSFSTSCEFLATLHYHKRATFIGEEPAGGYYGCTAGRVMHIELPNSKLMLLFGLTTYYQAVSGYKPDRGVLPDFPVRHTISDLIANNDRDMELALSLARKP